MQNFPKGKKQWFIGYKAHLAVDDFGVPISYVLSGACVHDSQVAVLLIKLALRYQARTTVERTNSELKDGYLPALSAFIFMLLFLYIYEVSLAF
ncbi:MAG: hypothetical protein B6241_09350 [Spirochaetaceae bacterium 4572_59]|nr:MAG: hypothetical protein B6241_09350 [Spirochaetaceae bacterium 4572_59]